MFDYAIESPKPKGPVDESAVGDPPFRIRPTADNLDIVVKHAGSAVQPGHLDIELSVPGSPAVRTIPIGQRQWINSGGAWQELTNPAPSHPCRPRCATTFFPRLT